MAVISTVPSPDFLKLIAHDLRWQLLLVLAHSDYRGQELVAFLKQPQNLISYHLRKLIGHHLVTERRSSADSRDIYYSLDLDRMRELYTSAGEALHPALSCLTPGSTSLVLSPKTRPYRVLFLCTHNSARSQMAEGILRHLGGSRFEVFSAGNQPAGVHPGAIRVMAAAGIDISQQRSKHLDEFAEQTFDYVITVCDRVREACPVFPGAPDCIHWSIPDPVVTKADEASSQAFRDTVRQLTRRISYLLTTI